MKLYIFFLPLIASTSYSMDTDEALYYNLWNSTYQLELCMFQVEQDIQAKAHDFCKNVLKPQPPTAVILNHVNALLDVSPDICWLDNIDNEPDEAFFCTECPTCEQFFRNMKKQDLEQNIHQHHDKCFSFLQDWEIENPSLCYSCKIRCPLLNQFTNTNKRCVYDKTALLKLSDVMRKSNNIKTHLIDHHSQKITPEILEKFTSEKYLKHFIQHIKTVKQEKPIKRIRRSSYSMYKK